MSLLEYPIRINHICTVQRVSTMEDGRERERESSSKSLKIGLYGLAKYDSYLKYMYVYICEKPLITCGFSEHMA